jgi:hypothetical protein
MTNPLAIILGIILFTAVTIDVTLFGTEHILFLSQKFLGLIEWLAFWR